MRGTIVGAMAGLWMLSWGGVAAQGYEGVTPGSAKVPQGLAATPGSAAMLTWPGFQMLPDGRSRVFLQTTKPVKADLRRGKDRLEVVLSHVALPRGNAQRPLDTRFFNTPVTSIRAHRKGHDVIVELTVRADVTPSVASEKAPTGYYFTLIDFPAGSYQ